MRRKYTLLIMGTILALTMISASPEEGKLTLDNKKTHLVGIYPNPIVNLGTITVNIEKPTDLTIEIINIVGKKVKEITKKNIDKGEQKIEFGSLDLISGVYLCRIKTSEWMETKRISINH